MTHTESDELLTFATMLLRNVLLFAILPIASSAFGQDAEKLKQRCASIIADSLTNDEHAELHPGGLYRVRLIPLQMSKEILLRGLASEDAQVRLEAAEVLVELAQMEFEDQIRQSVSELKVSLPTNIVWRAALLGELGDQKAETEFEHWALHEFSTFDTGEWICPMMCIEPGDKSGKCAVCAMELIKQSRTPTPLDWDAKVFAIRKLQERGTQVSEAARSIVASDAPASARIQAAGLWAKEDFEEALPHIKIHLHSAQQYDALRLLADLAPKKFVEDFKAVIDDEPSDDMFIQMEAYLGLLRAGDKTHLAQFRQWVDQPVETEQDQQNKIMSIYLLGDLALPEDIERLEKLLDTDYRVGAAETLLHALSAKK